MACDSSSTDPECGPGNGSHCYDHDPACCHCGKPRPDCEHPNKLYTGSVYNGPAGRKTFLFYTCPDCKAHLKEEELDEPEPRCTCGPDEACSECPEPEEPPLTPEEEEELSLTENDIDRMATEGEPVELIPPPPQPDRRPPYLLVYSVQGHLYEVALPGDATVAALDGRLVITHQLGPVAGICQIAPITSEESV